MEQIPPRARCSRLFAKGPASETWNTGGECARQAETVSRKHLACPRWTTAAV
jgi:hypothetical protein